MAVKPHGLANRPGEPYPATFRIEWTHRESNSDFRHARAVSSRWTMSPCIFQWTAGESNPDPLVASQVSSRWTSSPSAGIGFQGTGIGEKCIYVNCRCASPTPET